MKTHRTCLALDLKDDAQLIEQYEHFHRPEHIWPEIPQGIREGGIIDMQIYRIGTRLFMIVETKEGLSVEQAFEAISRKARQPEWAEFMGGFQQKLAEAKPHEHWAEMKPIFILNESLK